MLLLKGTCVSMNCDILFVMSTLIRDLSRALIILILKQYFNTVFISIKCATYKLLSLPYTRHSFPALKPIVSQEMKFSLK